MTATAGGREVSRSAHRGGEAVAERREFAWFARFGLVARGVSYGIIGILAIARRSALTELSAKSRVAPTDHSCWESLLPV